MTGTMSLAQLSPGLIWTKFQPVFDACQQPTVQYVSADVIAWSVSNHISQLGASDQVSSLPIVSLRLLAVHIYNHCCRTCQPWSTLLADLLIDLYCPQVRSQLGASDQDLPTLVNTVVADPTHPLHQREGLLSVKRCTVSQLQLCVPTSSSQPALFVGVTGRVRSLSQWGQEFVTQTIEIVCK